MRGFDPRSIRIPHGALMIAVFFLPVLDPAGVITKISPFASRSTRRTSFAAQSRMNSSSPMGVSGRKRRGCGTSARELREVSAFPEIDALATSGIGSSYRRTEGETMRRLHSSSVLFPILPPRETGVARLAAEAEHAGNGHLIEFRTLEAKTILNRSESKRGLTLAYSINPYRGCEFGCKYCYARYTHEFLAPISDKKAGEELGEERKAEGAKVDFRQPDAFERVIFLKKDAAWLLEQELRRIDPSEEIALGTATDPYQPIERRARITRSLLEVFAREVRISAGDRDEVDPDWARCRSAGGDCAEEQARTACDDYDAGHGAGEEAGAESAAAGSPVRRSEAPSRGWSAHRDSLFAAAAGDYRQRGCARSDGSKGGGGGRQLLRRRAALSEAVLTSYLSELCS